MLANDDTKVYQFFKGQLGAKRKPEDGLIQKSHALCKEYKQAKFKAMMAMQEIRDLNRDFLVRSPGILFRKKMPKADVVVAYAKEGDKLVEELMKTFRVLAISKLKVHDTVYDRIFLRRIDAEHILNTFDSQEARKLRETKGLVQLVFQATSKWRFVKVFPPDLIQNKKGNKKTNFKGLAILATLWSAGHALAGQIVVNHQLEPCWDNPN